MKKIIKELLEEIDRFYIIALIISIVLAIFILYTNWPKETLNTEKNSVQVDEGLNITSSLRVWDDISGGDAKFLNETTVMLNKGNIMLLDILSDEKINIPIKSNWSDCIEEDEKILVEAEADNEPASFFKEKDNYYLYYSSDKEERGLSYSGGRIYCDVFNTNFEKISSKRVNAEITENNILLYDVSFYEDKATFLYAHDYLGDRNLCVEMVD